MRQRNILRTGTVAVSPGLTICPSLLHNWAVLFRLQLPPLLELRVPDRVAAEVVPLVVVVVVAVVAAGNFRHANAILKIEKNIDKLIEN